MYRTRAPAAYRAADVSPLSSPIARLFDRSARSFYTELLGGSQVWPTDHVQADATLYFLVEGQLVEVPPSRDDAKNTLELRVESPLDLAERCWDAGCTVRVSGDTVDAPPLVTDPLGRTIALLPRAGVGL